jgi:hypothetical protein
MQEAILSPIAPRFPLKMTISENGKEPCPFMYTMD